MEGWSFGVMEFAPDAGFYLEFVDFKSLSRSSSENFLEFRSLLYVQPLQGWKIVLLGFPRVATQGGGASQPLG